MGLLDQVIGGAMRGGGQGQSPIAGILMQLLSGQQGVQGGQGGGLNGLVEQFVAAGLENVVKSWVGTGANMPVTADQLGNVFGASRVQHFATQSGMSVDQLLGQLAQHLPTAVDKMTPTGQLPAAAEESDQLQQLMKTFLGGPTLKA